MAGAGRQAALSLFEAQAGRLSDSIGRRTDLLTAPADSKSGGGKGARKTSADESDDELGERRRRPAGGKPDRSRRPSRSRDVEEPEDEYDDDEYEDDRGPPQLRLRLATSYWSFAPSVPGRRRVVDDSEPEVESDLRRRAAWLLLMLAIVAVLLVVVISALVSTHNDGNDNTGPKALDPAATESGGPQPGTSGRHSAHHRRQHHQQGAGSGTSTGTSSIPVGSTTCSGSQTCILDGDPGNAIQAINDFRTAHGLPAVPGSVTSQAQTCALNNGNGCTGGWAETLLSDLDGEEAVQKIEQFAHFEDPHLTSIEVGWAYDPGAQLYYFAIVRND